MLSLLAGEGAEKIEGVSMLGVLFQDLAIEILGLPKIFVLVVLSGLLKEVLAVLAFSLTG